MAIARSTGAFIGTDESTLQTITNGNTQAGSEVDVLGDDLSTGDLELYAVITSTVAVGTIDIRINKRRVSGQAYQKVNFERSIVPTNGTQRIPLGRIPAARYMTADAKNNGTGANASVFIGYELFKGS